MDHMSAMKMKSSSGSGEVKETRSLECISHLFKKKYWRKLRVDFPDYPSAELEYLIEDLMQEKAKYWSIVSCEDMSILKFVPNCECNLQYIKDHLVMIFGESCYVVPMLNCEPFDCFFHGYKQVMYKSII